MKKIEKIANDCRKATLLIEKKQEIALTAREEMELTLHLAGCYICRIYEAQSVLINGMMRKIFKEPKGQVQLEEGFKDELKKMIADKMGK